jgi:hypothetical protein
VLLVRCLALRTSENSCSRHLGKRLIGSGINAPLLTPRRVRFDKYSEKFIGNSSRSYKLTIEVTGKEVTRIEVRRWWPSNA